MRSKLIYFLINIFYLSLFFLVFTSSFKDSIFLSNETKRNIQYFFPEAWGFFTRNPREAQLYVYRIEKEKIHLLKNQNFSSANFFGFSRIARKRGYEFSCILEKIPKNKWVQMKNGQIEKLICMEPLKIKKDSIIRHIKNGEYILKLSEPIPWAWSYDNQQDNVPSNFIKILLYEN